MIRLRRTLQIGASILGCLAMAPLPAGAQEGEDQSCAEQMTDQLRRFRQECLADLVSYVASQPEMSAKILSEDEKYYVILTRDGEGLRAEAVSRFNYPLMQADTENTLNRLGWTPPENESDNWQKEFGAGPAESAAVAEQLGEALAAYGLEQGEAISLTVGTEISG
jgi:hypothetical protein